MFHLKIPFITATCNGQLSSDYDVLSRFLFPNGNADHLQAAATIYHRYVFKYTI